MRKECEHLAGRFSSRDAAKDNTMLLEELRVKQRKLQRKVFKFEFSMLFVLFYRCLFEPSKLILQLSVIMYDSTRCKIYVWENPEMF